MDSDPEFRRELKATAIHRNEAFRQLRAALEDVSKFFHAENNKRAGVLGAQLAIVEYLRACGIHETRIDPFVRVIGALVDNARGIPDPIFQVKQKQGRARQSWRKINRDAILAAIAELYWRGVKVDGTKLHIAMNQAAREITKAGKFGRIEGARLKKIRDNVMTADKRTTEYKTFMILTSGSVFERMPLQAARSAMHLADNHAEQ